MTTFLFLLLSVRLLNISGAAEFTSECNILVEVKNALLFDGLKNKMLVYDLSKQIFSFSVDSRTYECTPTRIIWLSP